MKKDGSLDMLQQNLSANSESAQIAALMKNDGYKMIKGVCEDIDVGNITTSMHIRSGKRLISLLIPNGEAKASGAEVGQPIYCMIKGKDIYVFRDIKYMMTKLLEKDGKQIII
jgi:molybdopterin-binding protein